MNLREAEHFMTALRAIRAEGGRAASATVVRVHGSAYRQAGARMLVRPDGTYECALSGGCLEPAVAQAAARVIATGERALVTYDLADDSVWGLNIGCTGRVDILIERLDDDVVLDAWLDAVERGVGAVNVTSLAAGGGRRLYLAGAEVAGRLDETGGHAAIDERARARLADPDARSGVESVDGVDYFFEVNRPPPALVIFGAGHDAVPLARHAWALGFAVTVADPRAAYLRSEVFPGARCVATAFLDLATTVPLDPASYAVIMSHHTDRDRLALGHCLASSAAYIGVLGPRARYEQLLAALHAEGRRFARAAIARVHSPVGLAIGAETPDEVATSILAEVIAVREGFAGGFLTGGTGGLHRPARAVTPSR